MKTNAFVVMLAVAWAVATAWAVPLETTVTYVSPTALYLDVGLLQGVQKGDPGEIRRADSLIARIEVEFVADHSSSCRITESSGTVRVGDRVTLQIVPPAAPPDTTKITTAPAAPTPPPPAQPPKPRINHVTGSIGVQALTQNDLSAANRDFVEPGAVLRLQVDNLGGTQHAISVRLRSLKTDRPIGQSESWTHRLYEFALYYRNPEARFAYGAGRFISNRMSGIGYLDGATFEYRVASFWSVGAFGGAQPDQRTYGFDRHQTKAGAFAAYDRGDFTTGRLSATLALAGDYFNGNISREFGYQQLSYSVEKLFLYESAEMNINRGWRKAAEGSSLNFSNILLNARYTPRSWLVTNFSYDNRTTFRTYETRSIADSLFDHALRQGWRLGANVRLPSRFFVMGEGGIRTKQHEGVETRTWTAGAGTYDLVRSSVQISARWTAFRGRFSDGNQPAVSVSRAITRFARAGLEWGNNRYKIEQSTGTVNTQWVRLNADWYLSRHVYGSTFGELDRGGGLDANRGFLEIGYRF